MRRPFRPRLMLFVLLVGFLVVAGLPVLLNPDLVPSSLRTPFSPGQGPTAQILYRPESNSPFESDPADRETRDSRFQTQMAMLVSPNVLTRVAIDPSIRKIDAIKNAASPEDAIREALLVRGVGEGTNLIEVSSRGLPRVDAAILVNAAVDAWLETGRELSEAMYRDSIRQLEDYRVELSEEAESLSQALKGLDSLQLEPDGPRLPRDAAEAELLDCLGRIRDLRLELAGLGDDPANANADALASLERREALLVADRDRIALALEPASDAAVTALQAELDALNQRRKQVDDRLEALRFDSRGGERFTLLSRARP